MTKIKVTLAAAAAALLALGLGLSAVPAHAQPQNKAASAHGAMHPNRTIFHGKMHPNRTSFHRNKPLSAADPTGVCWSNSNPAKCWRQSGSPTKIWPRDIAGDSNQQYTVKYLGQSSSSRCPEYDGVNVGIYEFVSTTQDSPLGASYFSGGVYWVGAQEAFNVYSEWAWFSNGVIDNCGDAQQPGQLGWCIYTSGTSYTQLYTKQAAECPAWTQVHV